MDKKIKSLISMASLRRGRSPAPSFLASESRAPAKISPGVSFDLSVSNEALDHGKRPSGSSQTEGLRRFSSNARHQAARPSIAESNRILGKIELQMASGPKWMWVRRFSLALFFGSVTCVVAAALVSIVQTPECKPTPKLEWWQKGPLYLIALQSFRDTTADGIGDLRGIQRQLQYIAQLNVVAIIIVPYDNLNQSVHARSVSRLREDIFGDTEDLKPLLKAATKYGLKVILDLTLFSAPLESNISASIDHDNENILQHLMTEFRFWFREGVDGIFINLSTVISEKTFVIELLKTWKNIARRYSSSSKKRIFIIATSKEEHDYLISALINVPGVMIFVYYLNDLLTNSKITEKAATLEDYNHKLAFEWCGFIFGEGHIASMILQRQQGIHIKLFAILLLTMPGTPLFYYGDEIALKDYKESKYPLMRWDKSKYAGFTNSLPWISPDLNVYTPTVSQQSEDPLSVLSFYRALGKIRIEEPPLQYGDFYIMMNTTNVLAYIRQWDQTGILVIMNFGGPVTYDFTAVYLPSTALLLVKSSDVSQCGLINLQNMVIEANMGYVLKYFIAE